MAEFTIRKASVDDVSALAPLFDAYRVFYDQKPDLKLAESFLRARVKNGESHVFLAEGDEGEVLGFVQLYPLFSSTSTPPGQFWVVNDLFVNDTVRKRGIGRALLERAERFARDSGAVGLTLSTATDNLRAQRLYEEMGYRRDTVFFVYNRMF